jgi:hypothetical protein
MLNVLFKPLYPFCFFLCFLLIGTCCQGQTSLPASVMFGVYFGKCEKHCAPMFQYTLKDSVLLSDTTDSFLRKSQVTCSVPVRNKNKLFLASDIVNHIPVSMLVSSKPLTTLGCPDCTNGGGIYLELKSEKGMATRFMIDFQTDHLDGDVKIFADYFEMQMSKMCK